MTFGLNGLINKQVHKMLFFLQQGRHNQDLDVYKNADCNLDLYPKWIHEHGRLKKAFAHKISCAGTKALPENTFIMVNV